MLRLVASHGWCLMRLRGSCSPRSATALGVAGPLMRPSTPAGPCQAVMSDQHADATVRCRGGLNVAGLFAGGAANAGHLPPTSFTAATIVQWRSNALRASHRGTGARCAFAKSGLRVRAGKFARGRPSSSSTSSLRYKGRLKAFIPALMLAAIFCRDQAFSLALCLEALSGQR